MAILSINTDIIGFAGKEPKIIYIDTDDTTATVITAGYLTASKQLGHQYSNKMLATVSTVDSGTTTVGTYEVVVSGDSVSLQAPINPGNVTLPVTDDHIAVFDGTTGKIKDDAAIAINGGHIQAGLSGTAGYTASFPGTAAKGSLRMTAVDNTGDTLVTISNALHGQASVYSIPDGGQATAEFIISDSAGTQNITSGNLQVDAGNIIAGSDANAGYFESHPGTTLSGTLRLTAVDSSGDFLVTISNASHAQATVMSIPDGGQSTGEFIISDSAGTQAITSGSLQVNAGNLLAGSDANAGTVSSFPATTISGELILAAVDNAGGNFDTTISNAASVGQTQVISIPDAGAATGNFLLDTGAANIIAKQEFVGLNSVILFTVGTWTTTRGAQGNYFSRKSAADETAVIGIDVTPQIVATASKGFRLDSFDLIYEIGTVALDAHSVTLDRIEYANEVAVSVNTIAITSTLLLTTNAEPRVTNSTIDTPAFDVTADSKYILEVTVDAAATTVYDFYGVMLKFSETIA